MIILRHCRAPLPQPCRFCPRCPLSPSQTRPAQFPTGAIPVPSVKGGAVLQQSIEQEGSSTTRQRGGHGPVPTGPCAGDPRCEPIGTKGSPENFTDADAYCFRRSLRNGAFVRGALMGGLSPPLGPGTPLPRADRHSIIPLMQLWVDLGCVAEAR